jgi:hypothetical protein
MPMLKKYPKLAKQLEKSGHFKQQLFSLVQIQLILPSFWKKSSNFW